MYKEEFKYYRRKCPPPDYSKVVDVSRTAECSEKLLRITPSLSGEMSRPVETFLASLMIPPSQWKIYEITDKPGLLFISNPFTPLGQRYWVCRCLKDYPRKPHRLNLDAHGDLKKGEDWWETCQNCGVSVDPGGIAGAKLYRKNLDGPPWDTTTIGILSEDEKDAFPSDLASLSSYVAKVVGFHDEFLAQAAIVNFYHFDSTLSGHTDHSEVDITAPLFSFSFGQTAIFLLGGPSPEDEPTPIYIQSGDIVIMSGYSRQCYHGIPKVMPAVSQPWEDVIPKEIIEIGTPVAGSNQETREQLTKYEDTLKRPREEDDEVLHVKRYKDYFLEEDFVATVKDLRDEKFWKPFRDYIQMSRINMNVRQVLPKGQEILENKSS